MPEKPNMIRIIEAVKAGRGLLVVAKQGNCHCRSEEDRDGWFEESMKDARCKCKADIDEDNIDAI